MGQSLRKPHLTLKQRCWSLSRQRCVQRDWAAGRALKHQHCSNVSCLPWPCPSVSEVPPHLTRVVPIGSFNNKVVLFKIRREYFFLSKTVLRKCLFLEDGAV